MFMYSHWLALPLPERQKLATLFGIAKTGPTHVQDNRVVADGFSVADVERQITVEALQKFLRTDEKDHTILWQTLLNQIRGVVSPPIVEEKKEEVPLTVEEVVAPKKRGRPAKPKMIA